MSGLNKNRKEKRQIFKSLAMVTQFGINMLVPIFLCSFIGMALDKWLGTSFIMIVLFFVGAAAGFRNIFLMSRDIYDDGDNRKRKH